MNVDNRRDGNKFRGTQNQYICTQYAHGGAIMHQISKSIFITTLKRINYG